MTKKILIISPKFPIPTTGACEQERLAGMVQLKRLGYDVKVVSKIFDWQDEKKIKEWGIQQDITIDLIPYEFTKAKKSITRFLHPKNWDGAAYEYTLPETQAKVTEIRDAFQPDMVWFDYTYLCPLYRLFEEKNIPIITRSINYEPSHFLQEDGRSFKNLLKYIPKYFSEQKVIKKSNYLFAITPYEEALYRKLGSKHVATLSLRSLPALVKENRDIVDREVLHLFFMGASYNVYHNRKAAELIIKEVAPKVETQAPGKFVFHILGKKLPEDLAKLCVGNVIEEGFVEDLDDFLTNKVDIAIIPSLMGAGMQQKIFEPLVYGIPSIVSPRGLAGYPYQDDKHVLYADDADAFVEQVLKLQDVELRKELSKNTLQLSKELFSQDKFDNIVKKCLVNPFEASKRVKLKNIWLLFTLLFFLLLLILTAPLPWEKNHLWISKDSPLNVSDSIDAYRTKIPIALNSIFSIPLLYQRTDIVFSNVAGTNCDTDVNVHIKNDTDFNTIARKYFNHFIGDETANITTYVINEGESVTIPYYERNKEINYTTSFWTYGWGHGDNIERERCGVPEDVYKTLEAYNVPNKFDWWTSTFALFFISVVFFGSLRSVWENKSK